jgi:hypothetical protein
MVGRDSVELRRDIQLQQRFPTGPTESRPTRGRSTEFRSIEERCPTNKPALSAFTNRDVLFFLAHVAD